MACHIKLITERLLWVFCQTAGQRSAIIGSCICPGSHHLVLCISNLLCIVWYIYWYQITGDVTEYSVEVAYQSSANRGKMLYTLDNV